MPFAFAAYSTWIRSAYIAGTCACAGGVMTIGATDTRIGTASDATAIAGIVVTIGTASAGIITAPDASTITDFSLFQPRPAILAIPDNHFL